MRNFLIYSSSKAFGSFHLATKMLPTRTFITSRCIQDSNKLASQEFKQLNIRQYSDNVELASVDFTYVKKATEADNILIVDVREPEEVQELGKIPNSINIPLGNVTQALSGLSEKEFKNLFNRPKPTHESEIIFYCMIGKRSGKAQKDAFKLGFKGAKNYDGSWTDWAANTK